MGVYQKLCYKVEDVFVKFLSKNKDSNEVEEKIHAYRQAVAAKKAKKKEEEEKRKEIEKQQVLSLLSKVVDIDALDYTPYEYNEVRKNRRFFENLTTRVFEPGEYGRTFIFCEFDKSSKKEIKGYLIATNKRVLFLTKNLTFMEKLRYQTIINVSWFKDGMLEKGIYIQYGKRRLEFDEMFDFNQMKRIANLILNMSSR